MKSEANPRINQIIEAHQRKNNKTTNEEQVEHHLLQGKPIVEDDATVASFSYSTNREEQGTEGSNDLGNYIGLQRMSDSQKYLCLFLEIEDILGVNE
ncbi:hypothetical protein JTB14_012180 [Gonioctena quinquepunctata]|nr:hypothetical protein JTB14_012180 [Gonioctena quinquepunctata]